jgi:hypothetical protein
MKIALQSAIAVTFLAVAALQAPPALAQSRVFVAAQGADANPCTFAFPCRTFQHAHDVATANGEIDVLDPAGYGPVTINKAISIQTHGFAGITVTSGDAITINAGPSDTVNLRGLLLDGGGSGHYGIHVGSAWSVQMQDCVARGFLFGLVILPSSTTTVIAVNTQFSANATLGISVQPVGGTSTLFPERAVIDGGSFAGLSVNTNGIAMVRNSLIVNNATGVIAAQGGIVKLTGSTIMGNAKAVDTSGNGFIYSYADNQIDGNTDNTLPITVITRH